MFTEIVKDIPDDHLKTVIRSRFESMMKAGSAQFLSAESAIKGEKYCQLNEMAIPGQTVFAGDSIAEGYPCTELFVPFTRDSGQVMYNRGIGGETSSQMAARFNDHVLAIRPKNIVIIIGTNDIGEEIPEDETVSTIRQTVKEALEKIPGINIILCGIFPVNEPLRVKTSMVPCKRKNAAILSLNKRLKTVAADMGINFADLTAPLSNEQGQLRPEYSHDGLHPNVRGYVIISEAVLPLLKK